jgi:hypothetical protein
MVTSFCPPLRAVLQLGAGIAAAPEATSAGWVLAGHDRLSDQRLPVGVAKHTHTTLRLKLGYE